MQQYVTIQHYKNCILLPPDGTCDEGTVHLVGSDDVSRGRAIYCHNGTWHSLCRDHWNSTGEEARVLCQTLGYDISRYGKPLQQNDAVCYVNIYVKHWPQLIMVVEQVPSSNVAVGRTHQVTALSWTTVNAGMWQGLTVQVCLVCLWLNFHYSCPMCCSSLYYSRPDRLSAMQFGELLLLL